MPQPYLPIRILWTVALFVGTARSLEGQSIVGRTLDAKDRAVVSGAVVQVLGPGDSVRAEAVSDAAGRFALRVPAGGPYRLRGTTQGYGTVVGDAFNLGDRDELDVEMMFQPAVVALPTIGVVVLRETRGGWLAGVRERARRARSGMGWILTRDQIAASNPSRMADLLVSHPPRYRCPMTYMINELPSSRAQVFALNPQQVEAIEVYASELELPAVYHQRGRCGLTLVWIREDSTGREGSTKRTLLLGAAVGLLYFILR